MVTVTIRAVKGSPDAVVDNKARAKALVEAGVMDSLNKLARKRKLSRLTSIRSKEILKSDSTFQTIRYSISVE